MKKLIPDNEFVKNFLTLITGNVIAQLIPILASPFHAPPHLRCLRRRATSEESGQTSARGFAQRPSFEWDFANCLPDACCITLHGAPTRAMHNHLRA